MQEYFEYLTPEEARILFKVRTGQGPYLEVKKNHQFSTSILWISDFNCRLCYEKEEDTNHILNECNEIVRKGQDVNVNSQEEEEARKIISIRTKQFIHKFESRRSTINNEM